MKISVVTAVYNGEEYLEESIESILNQTYPHFEYIIVNDGSNDKTKDILNKVTDSRVKVIHLEHNGGAANALNIGIGAAKGKWIALQDADDVSCQDRLQRQLEYIQSDPGFVAVGSFIKCIPGRDCVDTDSLKWEEYFFNGKNHFRNEQFYSTPLCHGTGFFLKKAFEAVGGYDPTFKIAYDYDLWTRMFEIGEIGRVPEVLYHYRIHGSSLAHMNKNDTTKEVLLSTFNSISKLRYNHWNRKPEMLLLGGKNHFEYYRENLEHQNHYLNMSFLELDLKNIKKVRTAFQANEIDGIILVSNPRIDRLLNVFRRKGFSFRKNLFVIWMPDS